MTTRPAWLAALLLASCATGPAPRTPERVVLGYSPSWATGEIRFERLTHLAHAFLAASPGGEIRRRPSVPSRGLVDDAHARGVKVLLSLGGGESGKTFRAIAADEAALRKYVDGAAALVREFSYDGLDVDWEPTQGPEDRAGLVALVRALRSSLAPGALLTMAAPAGEWGGRWWDARALEPHVDWIHVMTYDFHGPWSRHAGHNAPLRTVPEDRDCGSVESAMAGWAARGWPKEKLVVGIPCYGRRFVAPRWYAKTTGRPDRASLSAREAARLLETGWTRVWDDAAGVPYLTKDGGDLVSYEDAPSAAAKGRWAREQGFRGVFFWSIDQDHDIVRAAAEAFR